MNDTLVKRPDGKYEERLDQIWVAEYADDPATGLWEAEVFKHDVAEWHSTNYASLEDARQAVQSYYNQI